MKNKLSRIVTAVDGWDVCIVSMIVIIALLIWARNTHLADWLPATVVIIAWYILVGRGAVHDSTGRMGLVFSIGLIPWMMWAIWMDPWLACVQLPLMMHMWRLLLPNRRRAIVMTILLSMAQGAAQAMYSFSSRGRVIRNTFQALMTCVVAPIITAVASVLICLWLERVFRWGQERLVLVQNLDEAHSRQVALEREAAMLAERERLAQDVHDTVAQDLAGLRLLAEQARRQIVPLLADPSAEVLSSTLDVIASSAEAALGETRAFIATTMPISSESSLVEAVRRITDRFSRETGVEVVLNVTDQRLPRDAEVVFVRCLQEGLSNVRKHSGAKHVAVNVTVDGDTAFFILTDDGIGMSDSYDRGLGYGLPGMRQRVELVGGSFSIESMGVNQGTTVRVTMPLHHIVSPPPVLQDLLGPASQNR